MDDLVTRLRTAIGEQRARAENWSCDGEGWPLTEAGEELSRMVAAHQKILDLYEELHEAGLYETLQILAEGYGIEP